MNTVGNVVIIARREFRVRVRTRSFVIGTLLLVVATALVAMVPIIVSSLDRGDSQKVAVYVAADGAPPDLTGTLGVLLNATPDTGEAPVRSTPRYEVVAVTDRAAARSDVAAGHLAAVLAVDRGADGDLAFTLYTKDNATGRTAQLVQQAITSIGVSDRLTRLGIEPSRQSGLFAPPTYAVMAPDPTAAGPVDDTTSLAADALLGFGMTVLIFMMIILYGTWVAMSVVEEKSSRVMEVVLNAVTPFELLTGKVLGVGSVALVQYGALLLAGAAALLLQGSVASAVLGESGGASIPSGLTVTMLLALVVYGVLGFLLYAVLYAAAGSLVSRQEDVNAAVMPMTLVSMAGYLVAVYAATGVFDPNSAWFNVLSQVPFVSPFLMISRIVAGDVSVPEVLLSIAILVVTIGGALWVAARIYAAGVLLYGQRPGLRATWRLVRSGS